MAPTAEMLLDARDLVVIRPATGWQVAVAGLTLEPGGAAALLGPSGCGKTSVLLGALGLLGRRGVAMRGGLRWRGEPAPAAPSSAWRQWLARDVAVVMQDAVAALDPLVVVGRQLVAAAGADPGACRRALVDLGMSPGEAAGVLERHPHQISGGQAQRCLLAVALLKKPRLLVLDEPTASLDGKRVEELLELLAAVLTRTGAALWIATHDRAFAAAVGARPFTLKGNVFRPGSGDPGPWPAGRGAPVTGAPVLQVRDLVVTLGGVRVLDGLDLQVARGEMVGVLGPSGAGKSTLLRVLAGILRPSAGTVQRPSAPRAVQMLFQDARGSLTPGRSVGSLIEEVREPGFDPVSEAAQVGLPEECLERPVAELSGGERRRAALLRALSVRPEVLLCDEPLASLDRATGCAVTEVLLQERDRRQLAMVLVTHDREWAEAVADRVLVLERGVLQ